MSVVRIFTDGACRGNGAPGAVSGCGVWFGHGDPRNVSVLLPAPPHTNQRAELYATMLAMRATLAQDPPPASVEIVSDSAYCVKGITTWMHTWETKRWCKYDGKPVANLDLWRAASADTRALRARGVDLRLIWVKGHSGDVGNDAADDLAGRAVCEADLLSNATKEASAVAVAVDGHATAVADYAETQSADTTAVADCADTQTADTQYSPNDS